MMRLCLDRRYCRHFVQDLRRRVPACGVAIEVVRAGREPDAFWDMFDEGL